MFSLRFWAWERFMAITSHYEHNLPQREGETSNLTQFSLNKNSTCVKLGVDKKLYLIENAILNYYII